MNKSKQLDFSVQDIFVGLDTLLKSWNTTILVGDTFFKNFSQEPSLERLNNYLVKNFTNAN